MYHVFTQDRSCGDKVLSIKLKRKVIQKRNVLKIMKWSKKKILQDEKGSKYCRICAKEEAKIDDKTCYLHYWYEMSKDVVLIKNKILMKTKSKK